MLCIKQFYALHKTFDEAEAPGTSFHCFLCIGAPIPGTSRYSSRYRSTCLLRIGASRPLPSALVRQTHPLCRVHRRPTPYARYFSPTRSSGWLLISHTDQLLSRASPTSDVLRTVLHTSTRGHTQGLYICVYMCVYMRMSSIRAYEHSMRACEDAREMLRACAHTRRGYAGEGCSGDARARETPRPAVEGH
jgi:hypothetical protein